MKIYEILRTYFVVGMKFLHICPFYLEKFKMCLQHSLSHLYFLEEKYFRMTQCQKILFSFDILLTTCPLFVHGINDQRY